MWGQREGGGAHPSQLLAGTASEVNEICPEFSKALGILELSWLIQLCSVAWSSGAVPLDWQTGVVAAIFKKGPS